MPTEPAWGEARQSTDRVIVTLERFLHIESLSGAVLIAAACIAVSWANSPFAQSYHDLWHTTVTLGVGAASSARSLHFWVNEGLMTIFFLVAGLEIRRELHEGALSSPALAALPVAAALGGVLLPASVYLALNAGDGFVRGWAVPIATDIAFALGVLALLGAAIPRGVRVLLLALAIIDDVAAVLVIALFYTQQLQPIGAVIIAAALLSVLVLQRFGIRKAAVYLAPGALLWWGMLRLGVHPTLAGVVLGLLTPVTPLADRSRWPLFSSDIEKTALRLRAGQLDPRQLAASLRQIGLAQRDMVPPAVSVQSALHPWVAFGVMPLFALANAGVTLTGPGQDGAAPAALSAGIVLGLLVGKPVGILLASCLAIRLRWCALPADVGWKGLILLAVLAAIGFTMSIFIATLAFAESPALDAAKRAILLASGMAALLALALGWLLFRRRPAPQLPSTDSASSRLPGWPLMRP